MTTSTEAADPLIDKVPKASPIAATMDGRIASVDALRGLTILLMIFVNDLGPAAPSWMHHIQPPNADGMTLADVVFPAFLFIVGVSIPLAFERAHRDGTAIRARFGHILARTASLLLLGVIVYNGEDGNTLNQPLWSVLAFAAAILAWCDVPRDGRPRRTALSVARAIGIFGLVVLLALYRREPTTAVIPFLGAFDNWFWLQTGWWGILGLIGWAYLAVAILTLILGRRREWLMGAMAILLFLHIAARRGLFSRLDKKPWLGVLAEPLRVVAWGIDAVGNYVSLADALGSLAAISMAGCLLGSILRRDSDVASPRDRLAWAGVFAIGLFLAGIVTDNLQGINKIAATPTWCLWSAALTCLAWMILYRVIDVGGHRAWTIVVRPAGANPLVAYFLHPIIVEALPMVGLGHAVLKYKDSHDPWVVVGGSIGMALFVCAATGLLGRLGLRMRL
jgi:predicted acyltransferase